MKKRYRIMIFVIFMFTCSISAAACNMTPQVLTPMLPNNSNLVTTITPTNPPVYTTIAPLSSSPKIFIKAPVIIDKTSDGQEIHANLVKFTGLLSSPDATVIVNNIKATVNNDGSYYAFLDLTPGENTIVIKTISNQTTTSDKITVTSTPPLAVLLDWPRGDSNIDYRKILITIHGAVSDSMAKVKVSNQQVTVGSDGNFTTQIQLHEGSNLVEALAVLGDNTDSDGFKFDVSNNGLVSNPPPGFRSQYRSILISNNTPIELKTGETTSTDFALQTGKYNGIRASNYDVAITRVSKPYAQDELPILPSLVVGINPSNFTLYPKIEYHSSIYINAGLDLFPADYYFRVYQVNTNSGILGGEFFFTVNVKK